MTTLKFIIIFLSIGLYSCEQQSVENKTNAKVIELCNKTVSLVNHLDNPDSCKKALSFLDSATTIDSNCFLCYYNQLMFLNQLKQFDKAIFTINKLIQRSPSAHDLYLTGGILYERIGDTVSSKAYFTKSLTICSSVLDTMDLTKQDYEMLTTNKAINLVMLGDQEKANEFFKKLYNRQTDEEFKKNILSMMNKSKKQLLDILIKGQYSH